MEIGEMGKKNKRKLKSRVDNLPEKSTAQEIDDWFNAKVDEIDREHKDRRAALTRETTGKVAAIEKDHQEALKKVGSSHSSKMVSESSQHTENLEALDSQRRAEHRRHSAQVAKIHESEQAAREEAALKKGSLVSPISIELEDGLALADTWREDGITLTEHERMERMAVLELGEAPGAESTE
jgi:hypothetical protein